MCIAKYEKGLCKAFLCSSEFSVSPLVSTLHPWEMQWKRNKLYHMVNRLKLLQRKSFQRQASLTENILFLLLHLHTSLWVVSQCYLDLSTTDGFSCHLESSGASIFVIQVTANILGKTKSNCTLQEFGSLLAGFVKWCESLSRNVAWFLLIALCISCAFPPNLRYYSSFWMWGVIACVAKHRSNPLNEDTSISDFIFPVSKLKICFIWTKSNLMNRNNK